MPIDWATQPAEKFNRLVEALVTRWYPSDEADVRVINGRGGDKGRDIEVIQGHRRRVFQLKHFPEGFSATWRKRRRQITDSMDAIATDPPDVWILAVPCTLTDSERKFVHDEATKRGLAAVQILDRAKLESSLAQHTDLVGYFNRGPELREDAKIYNRERDALLGGPHDLGQRVHDLGGVVDAQDPHWTMDFSRQGNTTTYALRPKHAHAAELSPIRCSLELDFGTEHTTLAEQWTQGMNYGITEPITLPPEVVRRWTMDGPEWIRTELANVPLELRPPNSPHVRRTVELRFANDDDSTRASFTATSTNAQRGAAGMTLQLEVTPVLQLTLQIPTVHSQPGKVDIQFDPAEANPRDVLDAVEFLHELHRRHTIMDIRLDGKRTARLGLVGSAHASAQLRDLDGTIGLAEDLDIVGRHTRQRLPYPASITPSDRIILRALRMAINGHCALVPQPRGVRAILADGDLSEIRPLLEQPSYLKVSSDMVNIELLGRVITIYGFTVFHPQMHIEDADRVLTAIDNGTAAGMQIHFRPPDGQWLRMYLDGRPPPHQRALPTPWGIPELEHLQAKAG